MEMECDYVVKSSVCSINEAAVYTIKSVKEELEDLKLEWFGITSTCEPTIGSRELLTTTWMKNTFVSFII